MRWYLPGAIPGAILGGYVFTNLQADWLQVVIGLLLLSTVITRELREGRRTFPDADPSVPSPRLRRGDDLGGSRARFEPLLLNAGILKERMIGTKAIGSGAMQIAKVGTCTAVGALSLAVLGYGLAMGAGALVGTWLGKSALRRMDARTFERIVTAVMAVSGLAMLWDQRELLLAAVT